MYVLIINDTGEVHGFESREKRTAFVAKRTPTYTDGTYVFRTYIQEVK